MLRKQFNFLPKVCSAFQKLLAKAYPNATNARSKDPVPNEYVEQNRRDGDFTLQPHQYQENCKLECEVCGDDFRQALPVVGSCGHLFCVCCMERCHKKSSNCPTCEHPLFFPVSASVLLFKLIQTQVHSQSFDDISSMSVGPEQQILVGSADNMNGESDHNGQQLSSPDNFVHYGRGCDGCGVYPVVGRCYRCVDCPASIGFDLCRRCMESTHSFSGRFNQNHTSEHRMEEVPIPQNLLYLATNPDFNIRELLSFVQAQLVPIEHSSDSEQSSDANDESVLPPQRNSPSPDTDSGAATG